jgi:hypothetical protein
MAPMNYTIPAPLKGKEYRPTMDLIMTGPYETSGIKLSFRSFHFCMKRFLICPNNVYPVLPGVDHMHSAGNAGIKRVHGAQNLDRPLRVDYRGADQSGFNRSGFVCRTPGAEVPR